ncbi:MAG: lysylphosphatidylglycerol synthase transmembrane domain-containing protein [Opitutaceae bacterium]
MRFRKKITALVLKGLFSLVVVIYLGTKVEWRSFLKALASVSLPWFGTSVVLLTLCSVIGALRWHALLGVQQIALPFRRTLSVTLIGVFFNSFLLGSSGGDAVRIYMAAKDSPGKKLEAAWSVLADRLVGTSALLLAALLILRFSVDLDNSELSRLSDLSGVCLAACGMATALFYLFPKSVFQRLAPGWMNKENQGFLASSFRSILVHRDHPWRLTQAFVLSFMIVALLVLAGAALAKSLALDIPLSTLAIIIPLVLVIISVPVSISGFGVREGAFAFLFGVFRIGGDAYVEKAILFSLFWFFITLLTNSVGGLFFVASPLTTASVREQS